MFSVPVVFSQQGEDWHGGRRKAGGKDFCKLRDREKRSLLFTEAVAKAELDDIVQTGFRQHPDGFSLESKFFATSSEDAARVGRDHFRFDRVPFHIIEVQVPTAIADQFEKLTLDLKSALSISRDMLPLFNQHATVREITPIPTR